MKNLFLFAIIMMVSYGCLESSTTVEPEDEKAPGIPDTATYSLSEISTHNSEQDCWLVINGNVYDVTEFVASHPGGGTILQGCGKDATELFETRPMGSETPHSDDARDLLTTFHIGELG